MSEESQPAIPAPGPAPSIAKTLRRAIRAAWDHLGLTVACSLVPFALLALPAGALSRVLHGPAALVAPALLAVFIGGPLAAGASHVAARVLAREHPTAAEAAMAVARMAPRAIPLAALQVGVTAALGANALFYLLGGGLMAAAGLICLYVLLFWWANCLYQWPLLVAADQGLIRRDNGGPARLGAVLRNAFVLAMSAPWFTFALLAAIIGSGVILVVSGLGAALILWGLQAFCTAQATRDQLVRFHVLPPDDDPDEPVPDEVWRLQ